MKCITPTDIPRSYFLDEVRDGFFVPSVIKKAWAGSLCAYKQLEQICDELGIGVFFIFGNLIGAIRHGGSIPWDDDIDVGMISSDFQVFKKYITENDAPGEFQFRDYSVMGNGNLVRKWIDGPNPVKNLEKWKDNHGFPFVSATDIIILDYLPKEDEFEEYKRKLNRIQELKDYADLIESGEPYDAAGFKECLSEVESVVGENYIEDKDGKLSVWAWKMLEMFLAGFSSNTCGDVASISHYLINGIGRFPEGYMKDYIEVPFEFTTVRVPIGYESFLRQIYGNYMYQYLDGSVHEYPYYKILEDALKEKYDFELMRYHYDPDAVRSALNSREKKSSVHDILISSLDLFTECDRYVLENLSGGDDEQVLETLSSCQELAMKIGETAEARLKNPSDPVRSLEEYCETIYNIYEYISNGRETELDHDSVRSRIEKFEKEFSSSAECVSENDEKKEILFLVISPDDWKSLDSIYEAAIRDDDYEVSVVAVPCYYRDEEGRIDTDSLVYDLDEYPINITDYSSYDIAAHHPDITIIQSPYDEYGDMMVVHPYFHSSNIVKYTEKLVFIPPFKLMEIAEGDGRSRYTLSKFIKNPGLVYADEIIVQSEGMRDVYVELLSDLTKEIKWSEKIVSCGTAIDDWYEREDSEASSEKKKVMYYLSPSVVFEYGKSVIKRTEELFKNVKENESDRICLRCFTDRDTERIVKEYHPDESDRFRSIMEEGHFSFDDPKDVFAGYLGDGSHHFTKCANREKPALLLRPDSITGLFEDKLVKDFFDEVCKEKKTVSNRIGNIIWEQVRL